jgi:hypothetical protein
MWPGMQKDCRTWTQTCQVCQRSKISLLSYSSRIFYAAGSPLPSRPHRPHGAPSDISRLHILSHCSWPLHALSRSHPHSRHHIRHRAHAQMTCWIPRLSCPLTITSDHGSQFESQLIHSLAKLCGIQLSRTIAHHPAANRFLERFHQTLKAAIMSHGD